ncbi:MAG TPA: ketopantoate reductase family protein [Anaerolineaceae bacterium]|jgi:2-dehydropantoate 2-reductase
MRFLVFGAGAIGVYVGGSLSLHGEEVVFLDRPEAAASLLQSGLSVETDGVTYRLAAPVITTELAQTLASGPFDAAILAVKSFDTRSLLAQLSPYCDQTPPILCLQNGVENEPAIAEALGIEKVIAGSVTTAIGRAGPGAIRVERLRGIGVAAGHPLSPRLAAALDGAGLRARLYPNARSMKWSKMLTNLISNASSAILDLTPPEILADPRLFRLEIEQLREMLRVMRRLAIPVSDLPGTPVRLLAFAAQSLPVALAQPLMRRALGQGRGAKMPSFYIDLHAGRGQSEVEYLNGAVARFGEQTGVPTPVNRALNQTLLALASGNLPIDTYAHQPLKWLERVNHPSQVQ